MAIEIRVPRLGWTMEEGTFQGWLKEDGDRIKSGDAIFVLEGEKAAQEVEATEAGILRIDPTGPEVGKAVMVGDLIGFLLAEGEQAEFAAIRPDAPRASNPSPASARRPVAVPPSPASRVEPDSDPSEVSPGILTISPRAARTAAALGVDWTKIRGTGRTGRIRERDVMAAASAQKSDGDA